MFESKGHVIETCDRDCPGPVERPRQALQSPDLFVRIWVGNRDLPYKYSWWIEHIKEKIGQARKIIGREVDKHSQHSP